MGYWTRFNCLQGKHPTLFRFFKSILGPVDLSAGEHWSPSQPIYWFLEGRETENCPSVGQNQMGREPINCNMITFIPVSWEWWKRSAWGHSLVWGLSRLLVMSHRCSWATGHTLRSTEVGDLRIWPNSLGQTRKWVIQIFILFPATSLHSSLGQLAGVSCLSG